MGDGGNVFENNELFRILSIQVFITNMWLNCGTFIFIHPFASSGYDMPVSVFLFFFLPSKIVFKIILTQDTAFITHDVCICKHPLVRLALKCCNTFNDHLSIDFCPWNWKRCLDSCLYPTGIKEGKRTSPNVVLWLLMMRITVWMVKLNEVCRGEICKKLCFSAHFWSALVFLAETLQKAAGPTEGPICRRVDIAMWSHQIDWNYSFSVLSSSSTQGNIYNSKFPE